MAVLQMQRMSICALKKNRKAILEKLQSMGVMEISNVLEEDEDFRRMDTGNSRSSFEKAAATADRALELLDEYAPVKKSMFASLEGKELVSTEAHGEVVARREELLKLAKRIISLDKQRAECRADILKLENSMESLKPWLPLDIPLNTKGTKYTAALLGTLPGAVELQSIYEWIAQQAPEVEGVDVNIISAAQDMTCIAAFVLKTDAERLEEVLRSRGFARIPQNWSGRPADIQKGLEEKIRADEERIAEIEQEIVSLASEREHLRLVADYYRVRADKYEVLGTLPQSDRTFLISGYVPVRDVEKVKVAIESKYDCVMDVEDLKEDEEAPVLLQNNKFASGAESVLESYGLPKKGEIDPSFILMIFYVIFFGMMLSDAAYGILVAVVCGVALKKFPRMSEGMHKSLQLFFWCGLSTLFWGVMFGGYFGDVVNVVSRTFFGHEVGIPAVWFTPLNDPMKLLVYSMLFGLIHMFTGMAIKGYMLIRDGKIVDFICDVVLWYMLLIGLILMLLPTDIFASIAQMDIQFPAAVNTLAKVLAIAGAVGIVLTGGRDKKNPALRFALGAYSLYDITSWLSDILSYSRLLALGLATGVIASVMNQMGTMFGTGVVGTIIFIVVFLIGHIFNLAINLLGAYVHTNRLTYVEFFGKFYEGGGRAFRPFKENTIYADVKEE
jgi:V/A-type H+-transporting ATPase subunit I